MNDITCRVIKVVSAQLGIKESDVKETSSFTKDLDADSLDLVELIIALEQEFAGEVPRGIPDEDAEKITSVGEAVKYIEGKLGG